MTQIKRNLPELTPGERIQATGEAVQWIEAADGSNGVGRFTMTAYTGGPMMVGGYMSPVVIDLAGLEATGPKPILLNHSSQQIVGHGEAEVSARTVKVSGSISGGGSAAEEVRASGRNGFPWKASVGVSVQRVEFVERDATAKANGLTIKGPANIVRAGTLQEVSFVPIAADSRTSVQVAASLKEGNPMDEKLKAYIEAAGFDPDQLNDAQVEHFKAELAKQVKPEPKEDPKPVTASGVVSEDPILAHRKAMAAEAQRVAELGKICAGNADIYAKAIGEGWDANKAKLEVLLAERGNGPAVHGTSGNAMPDSQVVECAFSRSAGLNHPEKHYSEKTLEASDRYRALGLQEVLLMCAAQNGYSGRMAINDGNLREVIRAAFSSHTITTLLTTAGNKFLLEGFNAIPQTWREVGRSRSVSDFKQVTAFRLTTALEYEEVPNGGEIKPGTMGQESYTMQAKTYAKMLSLTRPDIINDDLSAFDDLRNRLGMGAVLAMNKRFWTVWLAAVNAGTFWTSARGNYQSGASTTLDETGLNAAVKLFRNATGPDGNLLGLEPDRLLVPSDLEATARKLYVSQEMRDTTASTKFQTSNIYFNRFRPVIVPELSNSNYTGYSATHWFLACNPEILASAAMCFLNGVETPTIESSDADFDTLGIQMRGYHDFGVSMTEYRASVLSAGA